MNSERPAPVAASPGIDGARLLNRLDQLAAIGGQASGGVTRLAYSAEDIAARDLLTGWMTEAGLEVTLDAACNLIGRSIYSNQDQAPNLDLDQDQAPNQDREPAAPIVLGSHLDTVVDGGRLDGAYGVVASVEAVDALLRQGPSRHPIVVVAFTNEEGVGGLDGFDGSRAIVGRPNPLEAVDRDGRTLAERIESGGGSADGVPSAAWSGPIAAFIELHIEQGPVLDSDGLPIGIVTGVTGRRNIDITITGRANHAGTTPMDLRLDALNVAARAILIVEALPESTGVRVATTGMIEVTPNVRNVVPGSVKIGVDLRDLDDALMNRAVDQLEQQLAELADKTGLEIDVELAGSEGPVPADESLTDLLEVAATDRGLASRRLVSGAGHDAQIMADLGPMGMLFVPSRDGVSHSPREHTDPDALVAGADVLLEAIKRLDAGGTQ